VESLSVPLCRPLLVLFLLRDLEAVGGSSGSLKRVEGVGLREEEQREAGREGGGEEMIVRIGAWMWAFRRRRRKPERFLQSTPASFPFINY
jgi:hypothetical protein